MDRSRVVVGVDGSPLSKTAVVQAAHYASTRGFGLHVLHAFAPDLPMLGFGALADRDAVSEHGRRLLQDATARAHSAHPDLTVTHGLTDGYAGKALVASSHTAALVVVGAVGYGLLSRTSMGAVAMQVITHAHCPVLVVGHERDGAPTPGSRVVCGWDGSDHARAALATAVREAAVVEGTVEVVHAWEPRGATDPTLGEASSWEEYSTAVERRVMDAVEPLRAEYPDLKVDVRVVRDEPVHALSAAAEGAGVLVVGARGVGGFQGLHVGATALRLVGRAPCPVLVSR
ncbi:universal stress protein [Phycicoccus sp. CSK15P-2]|uniref:universal stress protein n=1 Tax=Phycicoccus sp. CSK15P-2 TaxID=2807627 RepID=UPI00195150F3|nr:universal stress protein [Phycicoccus sp. CSK15P-2]MBM6404102.1 universal stress protein [Phycicoccus sp. CSK15P-2]